MFKAFEICCFDFREISYAQFVIPEESKDNSAVKKMR